MTRSKLEIEAWCMDYIRDLSEHNQDVVMNYINLLACHDEWIRTQVERVECETTPTFKVNIDKFKLEGDLRRNGLRILFRVIKGAPQIVGITAEKTIRVIDMGDHYHCASMGKESVYADERRGNRVRNG